MLMPRRLGGSLGAQNGLFRVLLCRNAGQSCGAHWTANDSHALGQHLLARESHELICSSGALETVPHN